MFEYINMGVVILSGIFIFLSIGPYILTVDKTDVESKKSHRSNGFTILVALMAPFLFSAYTKSHVVENIKLFQENRTLKCSSYFDKHMVSLESGWSVYDDGFLKDSLLIRADRCS